MSILPHFAASLLYAGASLVVALVGLRYLPGADPVPAGMLLHHTVYRGSRDRVLSGELRDMKLAQTLVIDELGSAKREVMRLRRELDGAEQRASGRVRRVVVDEMHLLQGLVQKLAEQMGVTGSRGQPPPAAPADGGAPAPAAPGDLQFIAEAIGANRVDLYLQPVVTLPQRKVVAYEAFSRLRDAEGRILAPAEWMPLAVAAGLCATIDNTLLFRCVQLMRKVERQKVRHDFFCNISPHSLRDQGFFADFVDFMKQNPTLVRKIVFEFAQGDFAAQDLVVRGHVARLAEMGFTFAIDQVSDLAFDAEDYAARHVQYLKVDAEALLSLGRSPNAAETIGTFHNRLEQAGIQLVLAKVEHERQVVELLDFDVTLGQGFLFGQPKRARPVA